MIPLNVLDGTNHASPARDDGKNDEKNEVDLPARIRLFGVMLPGVNAWRFMLGGGLANSNGGMPADSGVTAVVGLLGGYRCMWCPGG